LGGTLGDFATGVNAKKVPDTFYVLGGFATGVNVKKIPDTKWASARVTRLIPLRDSCSPGNLDKATQANFDRWVSPFRWRRSSEFARERMALSEMLRKPSKISVP